MIERDYFYFYSATFDPISLIKNNILENIQPNMNYFTDAFGVLIDTNIFPELLSGRQGKIEEPPIPSNWHADISEYGAVFRSIELDKEKDFIMCELGCSWGCWMNTAGTVAKKKGLSVHLIGIEGDREFIDLAQKALLINKFIPDEFSLYHGIVSSTNGTALFPKQDHKVTSFGFEPIFDVSKEKRIKYLKTGKYFELQQISLDSMIEKYERIDLLHVDIQGGEEILIPSCIQLLTEKVRYIVIGTHSRQIEGKMFECLLKAGWILEIERPAKLILSNVPSVTVDGVQGWRNLRLLPIDEDVEPKGWRNLRLLPLDKDVEPKGKIEIQEKVVDLVLSAGREYFISVKITNNSNGDWESFGSNPVNISYHWLDNSGKIFIFDGERTNIEETLLSSGETKEQLAKIIAPSETGNYILIVTLVQEHRQWFSDPDFTDDSMNVTVC